MKSFREAGREGREERFWEVADSEAEKNLGKCVEAGGLEGRYGRER